MEFYTPMLIAGLIVACVFVQFNRMLNAEARKAAVKRQRRDALRQQVYVPTCGDDQETF